MKPVSWVNLVIGAWLLIAPFALHATGTAVPNSILMGAIILIIAAISLRAGPGTHVPAWINVAAGLWVLFSPWALNFYRQTPLMISSALAGALVIIFALVRASASRPAVAGRKV